MKSQNLMLIPILIIDAFLPKAHAVSPAPDGGYPGGNTAEGQNALFSLTDGTYNTAVGLFSLKVNMTGGFNTAVGAGTLPANTADKNTATGAGALYSNTVGADNTANGALALFSNTQGDGNSAAGFEALFQNRTGVRNTANGLQSLYSNTVGFHNTASGYAALYSNGGNLNTAIGAGALFSNTDGSANTAVGAGAGANLTTGINNIDIGNNVRGVASEHDTIRIGDSDIIATYISGISGQTTPGGITVFVNSSGKLGTMTSSARFKEAIKPMDKASESILALRPVSFRYKNEIDPTFMSQFGLVAEEVEKVNPDLVVRDKEGKPYSVRYDQVNAMLLNEFLKEHKRVDEQVREIQEQKSTISELKRGMNAIIYNLRSRQHKSKR